MIAVIAQLGVSLLSILALAWLAKLLNLGGDLRIRDEDHARTLAQEAVYGFVPTDMAIDRATITDARSGLSFEIAMYPGFRMNTYHVSVAWGVTVFKPEHSCIIIGGV